MKWTEKLQRLLRGRTVSSLSREMGLHPTRLGAQISRGQMFRADRAVMLARLLGVDADWLFDDRLGWPPVHVEVGPTPQGSVETIVRLDAAHGRQRPSGTFFSYTIRPGHYLGQRSFKLVGRSARMEVEDYDGETGFVPVLSPVAAGEARRSDYWGNRPALAEYYIRFQIEDGRAFALPVDGASMEPDFQHGDLVVVSPSSKIRLPIKRGLRPILAIIVYRSERTATLKLVVRSETGESPNKLRYVLQPINNLYPHVTLDASQIASVIPVLGVLRERPE